MSESKSRDSKGADTSSSIGPDITDCPLERSVQTRNARIYAAQISLIYLSAPALYVGFLQAGLCKHLQMSDTVANLPSATYLSMAWVPVIVAWLFPQARLLKRLMCVAYVLMSVFGGLLVAVLITNPSGGVVVGALIAHAAVLGATIPVSSILGWEALNRGVSTRLRGKALGWAFGWGPLFAVVGSLSAQLILDGKLLGVSAPAWLIWGYPYSHAVLFGVSSICMGVAAFLARLYQIPLPTVDNERESFRTSVIGGLRSFAGNRILFIACIAYLLVYAGNMVQVNMSIFAQQAIGEMSGELAGYQLTLRFFFKILCGFFLGWLLTRTNPKMPLLVTLGLQILGVVWVLCVPGYWFLLAFGINGAGELFGVYYMNYPVQCSPKSQVRRNVGFLSLLSTVVGLAPVFYGFVSDNWGMRASFSVALVILLGTACLVVTQLPSNPRPKVTE